MKYFLLIDDHAIVRSGVRNVIENFFMPCLVVEAIGEQTARTELLQRKYDVIIMDIQMPDTDSLELMNYISAHYPLSKTLIFSMSNEKFYAKKFLSGGAMGFISKEAGMPELKEAIEAVLNNKKYISKHLAAQLADESNTLHISNPFEKLSKRELSIAKYLVAGKKMNEISGLLNISSSTAGTFKARLYTKLAVSNLVELIDLFKLHNY
jgi:two-component system, NarL family, invasion response regulator UvrY